MTPLLALLIPPAILAVAFVTQCVIDKVRKARFDDHVDAALDIFPDEMDDRVPAGAAVTTWTALDELQARRAMRAKS